MSTQSISASERIRIDILNEIVKVFIPINSMIKQEKIGGGNLPETFPPREMFFHDKNRAIWISERAIELHLSIRDHWSYLMKYVDTLDRFILATVNFQYVPFANLLEKEFSNIKRTIMSYCEWRWEDGLHLKGPAVLKCCGGLAHGWDCINRVFIMECILYDIIGPEGQLSMIKKNSLTSKEEVTLLLKNRLLLFTNKPINQWDIRSVILQLRLISQRWNQIKGLSDSKKLRDSIRKLIRLCELRTYRILRIALDHPNLFNNNSVKSGGLNSSGFRGRVVCTPLNNFGMQVISNSGSWIETVIWRVSRTSSKLMNMLKWLDKIVPLDNEDKKDNKNIGCVKFNKISRKVIGENHLEHLNKFDKSAIETCRKLIDSKQIQQIILRWICPSIVGIDSDIKKGETAMNSISEKDCSLYKSSMDMAPRSTITWLQAYLSRCSSDYFLDSLMSHGFSDMRNLCILHSFQSATKRDNRNSFGFIETFFARIEETSQIRYIIDGEMQQNQIPYILKAGSDFVVIIQTKHKNLYVSCEGMSDALVCWSMFFKNINKWKIANRFDISNIYEPIIYKWMGRNLHAEYTQKSLTSSKSNRTEKKKIHKN